MKYLLILTLTILSGCGFFPEKPQQERIEGVNIIYITGVYVLNYKGHEYISGSGGIWTHSQSCSCLNKE